MIQFLFLQTIFLQSIDTFLTFESISQHLAKESNPTMSFIINNGWQYFFIVKIIGTISMLLVIYSMKQTKIKYGTLVLANLLYIFVFAYNVTQIWK